MSYDEATDSGGSRDSEARQVAGSFGARPARAASPYQQAGRPARTTAAPGRQTVPDSPFCCLPVPPQHTHSSRVMLNYSLQIHLEFADLFRLLFFSSETMND